MFPYMQMTLTARFLFTYVRTWALTSLHRSLVLDPPERGDGCLMGPRGRGLDQRTYRQSAAYSDTAHSSPASYLCDWYLSPSSLLPPVHRSRYDFEFCSWGVLVGLSAGNSSMLSSSSSADGVAHSVDSRSHGGAAVCRVVSLLLNYVDLA